MKARLPILVSALLLTTTSVAAAGLKCRDQVHAGITIELSSSREPFAGLTVHRRGATTNYDLTPFEEYNSGFYTIVGGGKNAELYFKPNYREAYVYGLFDNQDTPFICYPR